jgi:glycosyltransferase involved in cell wall biosynthesis
MQHLAGMSSYSLVIPVYKNEASIPLLLEALAELDSSLDHQLEAVFVVDGSPDRSHDLLAAGLSKRNFAWKLLLLSRNFGSFNAIRAGLAHGSGPFYAVMAADLQEPPELVLEFFQILGGDSADVVVGTRRSRSDPGLAKAASGWFWGFYRRFVQPEMPPGGVDIFGCNLAFRDQLLALGESNSSLVGLIFWLGFRRLEVPYDRRAREHGVSAWTLGRKVRYLADSIFSFTDFPIRLLTFVGVLGILASLVVSISVVVARLAGWIHVPGYAATVLVIAFLGAVNCFGLGVIGSYVWRAYENTKGRPQVIVMEDRSRARRA